MPLQGAALSFLFGRKRSANEAFQVQNNKHTKQEDVQDALYSRLDALGFLGWELVKIDRLEDGDLKIYWKREVYGTDGSDERNQNRESVKYIGYGHW